MEPSRGGPILHESDPLFLKVRPLSRYKPSIGFVVDPGFYLPIQSRSFSFSSTVEMSAICHCYISCNDKSSHGTQVHKQMEAKTLRLISLCRILNTKRGREQEA